MMLSRAPLGHDTIEIEHLAFYWDKWQASKCCSQPQGFYFHVNKADASRNTVQGKSSLPVKDAKAKRWEAVRGCKFCMHSIISNNYDVQSLRNWDVIVPSSSSALIHACRDFDPAFWLCESVQPHGTATRWTLTVKEVEAIVWKGALDAPAGSFCFIIFPYSLNFCFLYLKIISPRTAMET